MILTASTVLIWCMFVGEKSPRDSDTWKEENLHKNRVETRERLEVVPVSLPVRIAPGIPYDWSILIVYIKNNVNHLTFCMQYQINMVSVWNPFDILTWNVFPGSRWTEVFKNILTGSLLPSSCCFLIACIFNAHPIFFARLHWPRAWHRLENCVSQLSKYLIDLRALSISNLAMLNKTNKSYQNYWIDKCLFTSFFFFTVTVWLFGWFGFIDTVGWYAPVQRFNGVYGHLAWVSGVSGGKGERWKRKRERAEGEKRLTHSVIRYHQNHFRSSRVKKLA